MIRALIDSIMGLPTIGDRVVYRHDDGSTETGTITQIVGWGRGAAVQLDGSSEYIRRDGLRRAEPDNRK